MSGDPPTGPALDVHVEGGPIIFPAGARYNLDHHDGRGRWLLLVNRYQRDNLLWLLNLAGYGFTTAGHGEGGVVEHARPLGGDAGDFRYANTGDWNGEIALMLAHDDGCCLISDRHGDRPNVSFEQIGDRLIAVRQRIADAVNNATLALRVGELDEARNHLGDASQLLGLDV